MDSGWDGRLADGSALFTRAAISELCRTRRLRLRDWTDADIPRLFAMYSDPEVTRYLEALRVTRIEEIEARHPDLMAKRSAWTTGWLPEWRC